MKVNSTTIEDACGVGNLGEYNDPYGEEISTLRPQGGAGWVFASFVVGRDTSDKAYKEMCDRWPIVYISPVRTNKNSGNEFYFVIFDCIEDEHGWEN